MSETPLDAALVKRAAQLLNRICGSGESWTDLALQNVLIGFIVLREQLEKYRIDVKVETWQRSFKL